MSFHEPLNGVKQWNNGIYVKPAVGGLLSKGSDGVGFGLQSASHWNQVEDTRIKEQHTLQRAQHTLQRAQHTLQQKTQQQTLQRTQQQTLQKTQQQMAKTQQTLQRTLQKTQQHTLQRTQQKVGKNLQVARKQEVGSNGFSLEQKRYLQSLKLNAVQQPIKDTKASEIPETQSVRLPTILSPFKTSHEDNGLTNATEDVDVLLRRLCDSRNYTSGKNFVYGDIVESECDTSSCSTQSNASRNSYDEGWKQDYIRFGRLLEQVRKEEQKEKAKKKRKQAIHHDLKGGIPIGPRKKKSFSSFLNLLSCSSVDYV